MTPEQLDEIEKLAEAGGFVPRTAAESAYARALRDHALPLVKALREARVLNPPNGYFEDIDRLTKERDAARAEVEMLRGVGCGELREGAKIEDGPCGACLKCARRERDAATEELIAASREIEQLKAERDEARAEVERLREVVWKIHALADEEQHGLGLMGAYVRMLEIHKLTKEIE